MDSALPSHAYRSSPNLLDFIKEEVIWHSHFPVANLTTPLTFVHNPMFSGEYNHPSPEEMVKPNSGRHALQPQSAANWTLLTVESHLIELFHLVSTQESEAAKTLQDLIFKELDRLSHDKQFHWVQQRGKRDFGRILVNNGNWFNFCMIFNFHSDNKIN